MSRPVSIYGIEDSSAGVRFSKSRKAFSVIQRVLFGQAQRPQQRIEKAERRRQRPCLPVNRSRREKEAGAVAEPVSQSFPGPNMKENSLAQSGRCRVRLEQVLSNLAGEGSNCRMLIDFAYD